MQQDQEKLQRAQGKVARIVRSLMKSYKKNPLGRIWEPSDGTYTTNSLSWEFGVKIPLKLVKELRKGEFSTSALCDLELEITG